VLIIARTIYVYGIISQPAYGRNTTTTETTAARSLPMPSQQISTNPKMAVAFLLVVATALAYRYFCYGRTGINAWVYECMGVNPKTLTQP